VRKISPNYFSKLLSQVKMSDSQKERLNEVFRIFDTNDDGLISTREMALAIRAFGHNPTQTQMSAYTKEVNKDQRGGISFKDFSELMANKMNTLDSPEDIVDAFRVFDMEEKGLLSVNELRHVLMNLGEKLSEQEMSEMIKAAKVDSNGNIDYREFVKRMSE
jgi:Ca2+-binding EF-hand superfamily protein